MVKHESKRKKNIPEDIESRLPQLFPELPSIKEVIVEGKEWYSVYVLFEDSSMLAVKKMPTGYPHLRVAMESFELYHNGEDSYPNFEYWVSSFWPFKEEPPVYHGLKQMVVLDGTVESVAERFNLRLK